MRKIADRSQVNCEVYDVQGDKILLGTAHCLEALQALSELALQRGDGVMLVGYVFGELADGEYNRGEYQTFLSGLIINHFDK